MTERPSAASPVHLPFVRAVEERARRAWPAVEEERLEGWILRFAAGATRRTNSVHAVEDVADLDAALAECARRYRARGLVPRVHLHPAVRPAGLDHALALRGWELEVEACVCVAEIGRPEGAVGPSREGSPGSPSSRLEILRHAEAGWLDPFARWRGYGAEQLRDHAAILSRLLPERAFAVVSEAGRPASVGLAVHEEGWVGLFDIVTDPLLRRRGHARALVRGLLDWARARGAERAYLQVEAANAAALELYAGFGFREAYRYGYRRLREG